jgi:S-adenosylmethionine:tRNA ribosyltransferase-isomerase
MPTLTERGSPTLLDFHLPSELEASEPPEARGLARDGVRLMVSYRHKSRIEHTTFNQLPQLLMPGDLLVINTSGTMNAALKVIRADGTAAELHLSTQLPGGLWSVELRQPTGNGTEPAAASIGGETLLLPAGATARVLAPYRPHWIAAEHEYRARLWLAMLHLPRDVDEYLARYGSPIRYSYVKRPWPTSYYQTIYATEVGSAEMPSAGRAFTSELITQLIARGIRIAPLLLHTGVASLEADELPHEEFYHVPVATAQIVNATRELGKRVIAVGTTVVRALETITDERRMAHPGKGWTSLVVTPAHGIRSVDALLTGFHEPRSSHLAMLEALAGRDHVQMAYTMALARRYLWHEFGDLHLILP